MEETIVEETVKTKIIGKTYDDNNQIFRDTRGNGYKDLKRNRTSIIIEYYYNILVSRYLEFWKDESVYNDTSNYYWKYIKEVPEDDSHEKFNFTFGLFVKNIPLRNIHGETLSSTYEICIARFSMQESGNCCGSMTFYDMFSMLKGSDIGKILLNMIEDIAIAQSTSNLLCINPGERMFTKFLIEKSGFNNISNFENRNTSRTCLILSKHLPKEFNKKDIIVKDLS